MSKTDYPLFDCIQERKRLRSEIERLEAEASALRGALELFQIAEDHRISHGCCIPTCHTWFYLENEACLAAMDALAADAGCEPLKRLRQLERERDEAQRALAAAHEIQQAILLK